MTNDEIKKLKITANSIRKDIIHMGPRSGNVVHLGGPLGCTDILTILYFKFLNIKPENPKWEERDRFILSKGHSYTAYYAVLAHRGFFDREELWTARSINSRLQGHPDMNKTPGVDFTSGSLGNGFSIALGMAIGLKYLKNPAKVVVIIGDGETQEGIVWEAAMSAPLRKVDNLIGILDYNHYQSSGSVDEILPLEPLAEKWQAFGWNVLEMDGHDFVDINKKLKIAFAGGTGKPTMILANTIKGKGVSFMENNNTWHSKLCPPKEYHLAIEELDGQLKVLEKM